jgi:hypothetical protein
MGKGKQGMQEEEKQTNGLLIPNIPCPIAQ